MQIKNLLLSYWKTILVTLAVLYLSFASPSTFEGVPAMFRHADKVTHFMMYFGLTAVLIWEFWKKHKMLFRGRMFYISVVMFPVLLGGVVEVLQENFFKPRSGDWIDWLADVAGVLMALLIAYILFRKKIPVTNKQAE